MVSQEELPNLTQDQYDLATEVAKQHEARLFKIIKAAVHMGVYEAFKPEGDDK